MRLRLSWASGRSGANGGYGGSQGQGNHRQTPKELELLLDRTLICQVKATVEKIYDEDDSPAALSKLGIDTITGAARFLDQKTLSIEQVTLLIIL